VPGKQLNFLYYTTILALFKGNYIYLFKKILTISSDSVIYNNDGMI